MFQTGLVPLMQDFSSTESSEGSDDLASVPSGLGDPQGQPLVLLEARSTEVLPVQRRADPAASLYRLSWLMVILALMLVSGYIVPYLTERVSYSWNRGKQKAEYEVASAHIEDFSLTHLSKAFQLVSHRVGPSVVHINVGIRDAHAMSSLDDHMQGQGSGIIVDSDGHVLTNEHVVSESPRIEVRLSDGRSLPAHVVGVDRPTDLAVLKIEGLNDATPVDWGDSDALEVGAMVWAVGSPFGLQRSITFGILSAKNRSAQLGNPYRDYLQTDAAVNPGNSGGPLVDSRGRLIGINTAIVGESYQGISFALPGNTAKDVYQRLVTTGRVARGWLGVIPIDLTVERAAELGLKNTDGAYIDEIASNFDASPSPAQRGGMEVGDIVIRWNDIPVVSRADLFNRVGMTPVGSSVTVVVIRDRQEVILEVQVDERRGAPVEE